MLIFFVYDFFAFETFEKKKYKQKLLLLYTVLIYSQDLTNVQAKPTNKTSHHPSNANNELKVKRYK